MTTPPAGDGLRKDPEDWATGDEPATPARHSYLETLATDSGAEMPRDATKAHASQLIDELRARSPLLSQDDPAPGSPPSQ